MFTRHLLATFSVAALIALPGSAWSAATAQSLVTAQSEVTFVAKQSGVPLSGRFKAFSAQSSFDPRQPGAGQIGFTVDLGSVAIDADTDREMSKPEWFNTPRFPKAQFQSTAIKPLGGGKFAVSGKLSIKGVSRELTVPVQLTQAQGLSTAVGSFVLKRLDFKVGDGDWADTSIVANDVQVAFKLVLKGVPAL